MARGSRLVVAEAFVSEGGVLWRVASGPAYAGIAGSEFFRHGVYLLSGWEDPTEGRVSESCRALAHVSSAVGSMSDSISGTVPLPFPQ